MPAGCGPTAARSRCCCPIPGRAGQRLGWKPEVSLREGIQRTARWLAGNLDRYRIDRLHV